MGFVAICVGDSIAEMTQQFPVYNAIVEFVRVFVDEEFGWVVGIAYWYAFASVFAVQNLVAAQLASYWNLLGIWQTLAFFFFIAIVLVVINCCGVYYYGVIETCGGFLKICLLCGVSIFLYIIANHEHAAGGDKGAISDGVQDNKSFAKTTGMSVCYAIPLAAYSYLGIEIIAVTAFEARTSRGLRWPSQFIPYAVVALYLFCTISEAINIKWTNNHLPTIYGGVGNSSTTSLPDNPRTTSMTVNAAYNAGYKTIAGFINGCLIFSAISQSNTSLYVSSRTLYGISREMPDTNWFLRKLKFLSLVERHTGVPMWSLVVSYLAFIWLPFLNLVKGYSIQNLIEIIAVSASVSCLIVWAALCLAYIQYWRWLRKCGDGIEKQYQRDQVEYTPRTALQGLQPVPAILGLLGCLLFFVFTSTTWWSTPVTFTKVAVAYAAQIICFVFFIFLKLMNKRLFKKWGVGISNDPGRLSQELDRLKAHKVDETTNTDSFEVNVHVKQ